MFTGNEHHNISIEDASELTANYRSKNPDDRKGGFFGKAALLSLLNQSNCVGIRFYYGLDADYNKVLVLVGADSSENDLIGDNLCMDMACPCPEQCGEDNVLNS